MASNAILDRYIQQLMETSTPEAPAWNIEKIRAGKKNTWNYIDGCMIKALIELYGITKDEGYLDFADAFIDHFVDEEGHIEGYRPEDYNLDNVNAGKTLYRLYEIFGKHKYRLAMDTIWSTSAWLTPLTSNADPEPAGPLEAPEAVRWNFS